MQEKLAQGSFLLFLIAASLLFGWILMPFFSAILWALVIAILFTPLKQRWAKRFGKHDSLLSLCVVIVCALIVVLPLLFLGVSVAEQGALVYQKISSGEINLSPYMERVQTAFPPLQHLLSRFGVNIGSIKQHLTEGAMQASSYIATQALSIGQNTFQFGVSLALMLYMAFFFIRDGDKLLSLLIRALPLGDARERLVLGKLAGVTSATIKGNLVVAIVQGSLGGLIFWILGVQGALLWAMVMAVSSLIPSIGSALIWGPVAAYFLLSGAIWQGLVLIAFCAGVIGAVDNVLRPILVGRETKMPDYLVLLSTLGGISVFGLNGFVLGPVIAALFLALWEIFMREFNP